jgi:CubicO group peptidase (beta-lactamase class C family)
MIRQLLIAAIVAAGLTALPAAQSAIAPAPAKTVDEIFAKWSASTPGCAVGVAVAGKPVLVKAYGMADLEHDVRNTPDTIFEAGSVSKQFTAIAVLLLAKEGKLSIDDPVRKYIPELPDYKVPLTIRHMLNHTSGLRDWGSVESIAGWPRTTREYTHSHVLDIVSRQKSLNFTPGDHYSYSNTGYNLAAIIVSRVTGMPFAEFEQKRIFQPLGLTHTSWRDDHTRIVKGRAIAYEEKNGEYHTLMPFENVHGNGGLLTTVGDLLKWNENFVNATVGDAALLRMMETPGKFNDGKPQAYAFGLMVDDYRGVRNIDHSGSTAGYRAHLNRFPDSRTSVAVLCNTANSDATRSANRVSDVFLGDHLKPVAPSARPAATPAAVPALTPAQLNALAGNYWSDEAEAMLTVEVQPSGLVMRRRPDTVIELTAIDRDKFRGSIGTVTFIKNAQGTVEALSINQERVWDIRFARK